MIYRRQEIDQLKNLIARYPVGGIFGARQVGKTTLARMLVKPLGRKSHFLDTACSFSSFTVAPRVGAWIETPTLLN